MDDRKSQNASTGPRSEERGNAGLKILRDVHEAASTGPRSEERGNTTYPITLDTANMLQRGRAPKSAEIHCAMWKRGKSDSFNGAALRRARKYYYYLPRRHCYTCSFNGAALRRARK